MAAIDIYTTSTCPYCVKAKTLFKQKGVEWNEINLNQNPEARDEMVKRAGKEVRTVPQIFIDDKHVGGCDDLYALNQKGELDKLLGKSNAVSR